MIVCTSQALELEDLPEDDEEDIDFTLEGLLGPLESDAEDNAAGAELYEQLPHSQAAAQGSKRHTAVGAHDSSR